MRSLSITKDLCQGCLEGEDGTCSLRTKCYVLNLLVFVEFVVGSTGDYLSIWLLQISCAVIYSYEIPAFFPHLNFMWCLCEYRVWGFFINLVPWEPFAAIFSFRKEKIGFKVGWGSYLHIHGMFSCDKCETGPVTLGTAPSRKHRGTDWKHIGTFS